MSLSTRYSYSQCGRCFWNLPQGVYGIQIKLPKFAPKPVALIIVYFGDLPVAKWKKTDWSILVIWLETSKWGWFWLGKLQSDNHIKYWPWFQILFFFPHLLILRFYEIKTLLSEWNVHKTPLFFIILAILWEFCCLFWSVYFVSHLYSWPVL